MLNHLDRLVRGGQDFKRLGFIGLIASGHGLGRLGLAWLAHAFDRIHRNVKSKAIVQRTGLVQHLFGGRVGNSQPRGLGLRLGHIVGLGLQRLLEDREIQPSSSTVSVTSTAGGTDAAKSGSSMQVSANPAAAHRRGPPGRARHWPTVPTRPHRPRPAAAPAPDWVLTSIRNSAGGCQRQQGALLAHGRGGGPGAAPASDRRRRPRCHRPSGQGLQRLVGQLQQRRRHGLFLGQPGIERLLHGPGCPTELGQAHHARAALEGVEGAAQRGLLAQVAGFGVQCLHGRQAGHDFARLLQEDIQKLRIVVGIVVGARIGSAYRGQGPAGRRDLGLRQHRRSMDGKIQRGWLGRLRHHCLRRGFWL